MDEIIPYIILILVLLVLELIQIVWAKSKIKKWILPILSFLLSVYIMIYLISFELANQIGTDRHGLIEVVDIGTWMMFVIFNIPTIIFINMTLKITTIEAFSESNIGNISSDVDKYIAINVPKEITLVAYKLVAATEKPHWGKAPTIPPKSGPNFPAFFTAFSVFLLILCSRYSNTKNVINKNGKILSESTTVSIIISFILIIYSSYNKSWYWS